MGRWKAALVGLAVIGVALILIPFAVRPHQLIIPMAGLGFAIGMVDSSMMPELGNLVDIRHSSVYGGVYAIGDIAFCLGFAIGPALSGSLVKEFGFGAMLMGCGVVCFLYCPFLLLLKDPPHKSQQEKDEDSHLDPHGEKTKVKYANFEDELIENGKPVSDNQRSMR
jgi:DHA1 family solute carrier family 18 vesicular amine transporter 1/2